MSDVQASVQTGTANQQQQQPAYTPPDWAKDATPELQAVLQAKGYKTPVDVLQAYDHAQRAIGADKIVLPKDGVWDADARQKLGIPAEAKDYKVTRPQMPDGVPYDEKFEAAMLPIAHKLGITPAQLNGLVEAVAQHRVGELQALGASGKEAREKAEGDLRREWGAAYDARVEQAKRAVEFAGGPELKQALDQLGLGNHPSLIKAFAKIGSSMSEDKLKTGQGGSFAMTPAEAKAELAKMDAQMSDPNSPLMNKSHPEHDLLIKRREDLFKMMAQAA